MWWIIPGFLLGMAVGWLLASVLRMSHEQDKIATTSFALLEEVDKLRAQKAELERDLTVVRRELETFIQDDLERNSDLT